MEFRTIRGLENEGINLREEKATEEGALKSAFKFCPNHAWGKVSWSLEKASQEAERIELRFSSCLLWG